MKLKKVSCCSKSNRVRSDKEKRSSIDELGQIFSRGLFVEVLCRHVDESKVDEILRSVFSSLVENKESSSERFVRRMMLRLCFVVVGLRESLRSSSDRQELVEREEHRPNVRQ